MKSYKKKVNFIFNSRFTYDSYQKIAKRNDVEYKFVYPAINHEIFNNQHNPIRENNISICTIGRPHKLKGLDTFKTAIEQLPCQIMNKIDNIYILSHDDLSAFSFPEKVSVIKPGSDYEIAKYYNESCIFVSTSWWEGFGLPALEAMSCGCAIITSDNKGCREYAVNNENSLFFEPKNTSELINCIEKVIQDSILRKKIAKQGEDDSKRFSWKVSAEQLKKIIKE